jgi:hypothetical protein
VLIQSLGIRRFGGSKGSTRTWKSFVTAAKCVCTRRGVLSRVAACCCSVLHSVLLQRVAQRVAAGCPALQRVVERVAQRVAAGCRVLQRVVQRVVPRCSGSEAATWHDWQPKKCATYRWIDVIAATASASVCVACARERRNRALPTDAEPLLAIMPISPTRADRAEPMGAPADEPRYGDGVRLETVPILAARVPIIGLRVPILAARVRIMRFEGTDHAVSEYGECR